MAQGQGFANVSSGISNIATSIFGNDGAANELAVLFGKNGQPVTTVVPDQQPPRNNSMMFIIIAVIAIIGLMFLIKK